MTHSETRGEQRGAVGLLAVFLMATVFGLFLTAFVMLEMNNSVLGRQLAFYGQATNAAQAGVVEALAWFRKQTTQPVTTFNPQRNLDADPPLNETDDASIGLVREYEISAHARVWGRYEVKRTAVVDISAQRGKSGAGLVWQVESEGIAFVRENPDVPYNQAPNRVLSRQTARTEFQRLSLVLPGAAGVSCSRGSDVVLASRARIFGGANLGIVYAASTGSPNICAFPCRVTGNPATSQANPFNAGVSAVFGVEQQELLGMADLAVDRVSDLPTQLPDMALIAIRGDAVFNASRPLYGSGVLVVLGSLTIDVNSSSSYGGLIYVTGAYIQRAPSQISGALVGLGTVRMEGAGDFSEISYDPSLLLQIQQKMGQYRVSRAVAFSSRWR